MCLGLPGRVVESVNLIQQTVVVDVRGQRQRISAAMLIGDGLPSPQVGQWLLVHMGFALSLMDETEALSALESMDDLSGMYEEFALRAESADSGGTAHSSR